MAAIANVTVKKFDGVTNIVYDALSGSGGDNSPAVWRQDAGQPAALPQGLRPLVRVWQAWNGNKTARVARFHIVQPFAVLDSTTGVYSSKDRVVLEGSIVVPQAIPLANIQESVFQSMNFLEASLLKNSVVSGFGPT